AAQWREGFPAIPGVAVPTGVNACPLLDFGPHAAIGIVSTEPPIILKPEAYPTMVPSVDADGNDVAGVRAPMVAAPLGTYTGWNIRARGHGEGAMHEFTGSYIPFPDTPEERAGTGDPRPSVLERYGDATGYIRAIEAAARALVADRLMLEEDVPRAAAAARDWGRPRHDVRL
ncbi:MAG: alpha/beta hydrolase domain-containing protein, partial [Alphaproteobacteria bacterium]